MQTIDVALSLVTMRSSIVGIHKERALLNLFGVSFLHILHITIVVYINSSFLSLHVRNSLVGIIYLVASLLTIFALRYMPTVLNTIGNYKATIYLLYLQFFSLLGIVLNHESKISIIFFMAHFVSSMTMFFSMDIFIEHFSPKNGVGKVRGLALMITGLGAILAPIISSFLLGESNYWKAYLLSLSFLIPIFFIIRNNFRGFVDKDYTELSIISSIWTIWQDRNLYSIYVINFMLHLFYALVVIYIPIYLHDVIGFSWSTIGLMLSIMLVPYVLIDYPLGELSDGTLGEKELLIAGLVIMSISIFVMSQFTELNFLFWAMILFVTRIGAAVVEVMSESYFFKTVQEDRVGELSIFRMIRPISYVAGTLLSSIVLYIGNIPILFILLSAILLLGLPLAFKLRDTV